MVVKKEVASSPKRLQNLTWILMFIVPMLFTVTILVFGVEDVFDTNPREYLPPSMRRGFDFIHGFNLTAIEEINRNLHGYINDWQAVQVFRPDVPKDTIIFTHNKKKLKALNQSHAVSQQYECALIGNAGILHGSGCGDAIDKFNFVIRMNLAPSGGEFKEDVGSKVNLTTLNLEQMGRLISCTNSTYPPEWKCKSKDEICLKNREKKHPSPRAPSQCDDLLGRIQRLNGTTLWFFKALKSVYFDALKRMLGTLEPKYNVSIDFAYSPVNPMKPASRAWNLGFPSSGIAIYSAATQFCQQITMFGFYPFSQDSKNRTLRHHYYEKGSKMNYTSNLHGMPNEYRMLTELNRTGAIQLVNECRLS